MYVQWHCCLISCYLGMKNFQGLVPENYVVVLSRTLDKKLVNEEDEDCSWPIDAVVLSPTGCAELEGDEEDCSWPIDAVSFESSWP